VFDPARDEDHGNRRFYARLGVILVAGILGSAALWPSITAFSDGVDGERQCLAVVDAFHGDPESFADGCRDASRRRLAASAAALAAIAAVAVAAAAVTKRVPENRRMRLNSGTRGAKVP
jgi:hypothetical protein